MSEPIEKVAERVLALDAERYQGPPTFATYRRMAEAETLDELAELAPPLAKEVLALRKLVGEMREALERSYVEVTDCERGGQHRENPVPTLIRAALASYRAHFPAPAVKPESKG